MQRFWLSLLFCSLFTGSLKAQDPSLVVEQREGQKGQAQSSRSESGLESEGKVADESLSQLEKSRAQGHLATTKVSSGQERSDFTLKEEREASQFGGVFGWRGDLTSALSYGGFDYESKSYGNEMTRRFVNLLDLQAEYVLRGFLEGLRIGASVPLVITNISLIGASAVAAESVNTRSSWSRAGLGDMSFMLAYGFDPLPTLHFQGLARFKAATGEGDLGTDAKMDFVTIPIGDGHHHMQLEAQVRSEITPQIGSSLDFGWIARVRKERELLFSGVTTRSEQNPGDMVYANMGLDFELFRGLVSRGGLHYSASRANRLAGVILENTESQSLGVSLGLEYQISQALRAHLLVGGGGIAQGIRLQQGVLLWGKNAERVAGLTLGLSGTL